MPAASTRALPDSKDRPYSVAFASDPEGNVLELIGLHKPGGDALKTRMQIGLTVADVERSRAFYGQTLGLKEEPVMEIGGNLKLRYGFVWGSTTVKFWALPGAELPVHSGPPADRAGIRMFTVMVEDLAPPTLSSSSGASRSRCRRPISREWPRSCSSPTQTVTGSSSPSGCESAWILQEIGGALGEPGTAARIVIARQPGSVAAVGSWSWSRPSGRRPSAAPPSKGCART